MAEESTLAGVIDILRAEGLLDRNSGTNSIKSLKQINQDGFNSLSVQMGSLIDFFKGNALQEEENRRELLKALKDSKKEEKKEDKKKPEKLDWFGQGLKGLAIAVAGLVSGFVVGLGAFFVSLLKPIKGFITESKVFKSFKAITIKFGNKIKSFGNTINLDKPAMVLATEGPLEKVSLTTKTRLRGIPLQQQRPIPLQQQRPMRRGQFA